MDKPEASDPNKKPIFLDKSIFLRSERFICLIFLFLNLADVATKISISFKDSSKLLKTFAFLIISLAPTEVASILSFGKIGLGEIINNLLLERDR